MAIEAAAGLAGGCQCGAVRYRLEAQPTGVNVCHCRMCQKAGGGPFMTFGGVRLDELVWTRGTPKVFVSSSIAERGFCRECGTPLTYRMFERDRISVTLGSLDDPQPSRRRSSSGSNRNCPGSTRPSPCRRAEDRRLAQTR